ncbi:unnamed protein product [Aureobasidium uvarum]|uniref:Myb/SANT-like domain-containing protein n=1 Tax=Aureobasidium uvarum TaxID=2773716 RepID=A0A9N8KIJ9_9PEZI|nr:unnamed protein product [Aureobasidium uvarum]
MDDTSISTDSPSGARSSRTQLKWTNDMEVAFIATMKSMQSPPTKNVPSGFTKDAYKRVAEIIKDKSSQPDLCDDVRMKNKLGALRNDWRTYVNLLTMQWPRLPNGLPTNTDDVLENYYKDQDPNARKFRAAPLRHFVELNLLFDPEGEQPLASPSSSRPVPVSGDLRQSLPLPHSPYETVDYQAPSSTQVHDLQDTMTNGTHNPYTPHSGPASHLSAKRPAETSISNQAKRILMSESLPTQPRSQDTLRAYYGNTSQISPVAAATALFGATFSSLPIRHKVIAVKHFQDTNMAEIFLHTDADVREELVNQWVRDAEIERLGRLGGTRR